MVRKWPFEGCVWKRRINLVGGNPTQKVIAVTSSSESWSRSGNIRFKRRQLGIRVSIEPRNQARIQSVDTLPHVEHNNKYNDTVSYTLALRGRRPNYDTQ